MANDEDKQEGNEAEDHQSIGMVQVKLPPFWSNRPVLWFARAEAQFHLKGIKSQMTKFHHIISALTPEVMDTVVAAIEEPDPESAYEDIKKALVSRHGPHRPTQMMEFGLCPPIAPGQDPCSVMDQIKSLKFGDYELEAGQFLSKMPECIRHDLLKDVDDFDELQDLALAARRLMKKSGEAIQVVRANQEQSRRKSSKPGLCQSHRRFGDRAWECQKPCSWTGRKPTGKPMHLRAIEDCSGNEGNPC